MSWDGQPFGLKSNYNGSCVGSSQQTEECANLDSQKWTITFNRDRVQFKNVGTGMCLGGVALTRGVSLMFDVSTVSCSEPFTWWQGSLVSGESFASGVFKVSMGPYCLTSLDHAVKSTTGPGYVYGALCSSRAQSQNFVRYAPPVVELAR